jgi:transcriptional regulator with XRE-family HTH domain
MSNERNFPLGEIETPMTGEQLRDLRVLAGFSRSQLERAVDLSSGRVRAIENGYVRLRRWESAEIRVLLFRAMQDRARAIAEHLRAGGGSVGPVAQASNAP